MADERNIDNDDEFESSIRKNPYAQLPSNSSNALARRERHEPRVKSIVENSGARRMEKSSSEFKSTLSKIKDWVLNDVLIPTAKDVISNVISNSTDMILYRNEGGRRRRSSSGSYASCYRRGSDRDRDRDRDRRDRDKERSRRRGSNDWEDIFLPKYDEDGEILWSRTDAEKVISDLGDTAVDYGRATVADLYDLVGITASHTDEKRGWYKGELRGACVRKGYDSKYGDGWLICTPDPQPFDD